MMFESSAKRCFLKGYTSKAWKVLAASTLALVLSVSTAIPALGSQLTEVRDLLESGYVEPVGESVLTAPSIDEALKRLGDPHTVFFTEQEYQDFIHSLDMTFSGIGVYIDMLPEGVLITSVMPGSPAEEAGLREKDVIIRAAGQSLAGLSQENAAGLLRGPEGSTVQIAIIRGEERLEFNVARRAIEVPTVTGEIVNGRTGYITIASFGETTAENFKQVVQELKGKGVDSWIIDVRDNPGGYLSSALSLAGFFIGDQTALQTKDRTQKSTLYKGEKQEVVLTEPIMFLTNENSASASEILTAVVKDYQKATILGNRTYGKGSVQSMFSLTEGGVLKMTVAKFYSPLGKEINKVGIQPDLNIVESDPRRMAELLLEGMKGEPAESNQAVQLTLGQTNYPISLIKARTPEYWASYGEVIRTLSNHSNLLQKSGGSLSSFTDEDWAKQWPLFYPGYRGLNELKDLPLDKKFTVRFTAPIDWASVNEETLELIESTSGTRIPVEFEAISDRDVRVIPEEFLEAGKTYWLLTHQGIRGQDGTALREGALAVAKTISDTAGEVTRRTMGTFQGMDSEDLSSVRYGIPEFKPQPNKKDYGQAILN